MTDDAKDAERLAYLKSKYAGIPESAQGVALLKDTLLLMRMLDAATRRTEALEAAIAEERVENDRCRGAYCAAP